MNKRIKELWEKSTGATFPEEGFYSSASKYNIEKFAELIVGECIEIFSKDLPEEGDGKMVEVINRVCNVAEHFGVEEQQKVASKPKCSVCGTTENVKYMGGHQPYLCDSVDCIPF